MAEERKRVDAELKAENNDIVARLTPIKQEGSPKHFEKAENTGTLNLLKPAGNISQSNTQEKPQKHTASTEDRT